LPGMKRDETIDICVGIDCSGSIDNKTLMEMLSEVQGIMSQYTDYKIHIWSYDTEVNNPVTYRADEGGDISTYEPKGGGGTNFVASYKYMQDNDIHPMTYINFTDGYCDGQGFGDASYCDTIFCIVKNGIKEDAPFGTTLRLA
jgi:predicted metal-dependent peptidase